MLVKPDLQDEKIIACLQVAYGLPIAQLAFLPLGGDLSSAVYRAAGGDDTPYFVKLRRGPFDETSVELPHYLSEEGIAQIIAPIPTQTGRLRAELGEFHLILYPFVEGTEGYEIELSERQWADFGAALKKLHTTAVPPSISKNIDKESYDPRWRERCREIIGRLDQERFDDPLMAETAAFLRPKREMILNAVARAEDLAQVMAARAMEFVLCHSDIHPGNLFIDPQGTLFIIDWDYPMLAPKERDLMFIGGGQGFMPYIAEQEEELFYRGYGREPVDPVALTYYRYERGITDIVVECRRVLSPALNNQDRAQALEILGYYFMPGCTLEMALKLDQTLNEA